MRIVRQGALVALLLGTAGCYTYQPVRPADAMLDARVRATVSPEKAAEVAPAFRGISTQLQGRLAERDGGGVLLEIPLYSATAGMSRSALKNRVYVPFDDLVTLETRKLSAWRTGAVVGALVAGVTTTWVVVGGRSEADNKPKTDVDNNVILKLPLRFPFW